jgi:multidrug efflux system outer membrane protein
VKRAVAMLALAGCWSMAPKYERPAAPIPAGLPGGSAAGPGGTIANLRWSSFVRDPKLAKIVELALANNRTVRQSLANVLVARAQYRVQRAAELPSIDATIGVTNASVYYGIPGTPTVEATYYQASAGLTSWEIDLFGKYKSLADAKLQLYLASAETARAAKITLIAETATAFLTLAADRSRLAVAKDTMASGKRTMELTEALVGGGTSNRTDFYQAETVFQQARADVAALTAAIVQDHDALDLLAGTHVDDSLLPDALPDHPESSDWFAEVPVGMSSSVLLDRPDVLAAEHQLISANANIGAARAAFFPSLSLTATGGIASAALAALFTGPAFVWTLAPSLTIPLFHGGANRANLDAAWAQKTALVAGYELAIQTAFREVADALATRSTIQEQLAAQVALVDASQKAFELAQARYKAGVDTFLTTLVAERSLYTAKDTLLAAQLQALANRVELYRALGGGG